MEPDRETRLQILLEELDATREHIAGYGAARARLMNGSALVMITLFLLGYTAWLPMAILLLPFAALYAVVHLAVLTACSRFARAHAAGLEERINIEAGGPLLFDQALASRTLGPTGRSSFFGITAENITSILSWSTLHFLAISAALYLAGFLRARYLLADEVDTLPVGTLADVYVPVLALWTLINLGYLIWYFLVANPEKSLAEAIRKHYQKGE